MEWVKLIITVIATLVLIGAFVYFAFIKRDAIFTCCVCIIFCAIGGKKDGN